MSRHMIVIVVSEVLARMHVLYHPLSQRTQVLRRTDQRVTQILVEVRMQIGVGRGGVESNHNIYTPTME